MLTSRSSFAWLGAAAATLAIASNGPAASQSQEPAPPPAQPPGMQQPETSPAAPQHPPAAPSSRGAAGQALEHSRQAEQLIDRLSAEGQKLIGKDLYGADNQSVGKIRDAVIGADGKLAAVLVDLGGFLGIGAKTVALPVEELSVADDRLIAQGLTKKTAEAMPEYLEPRRQPR
jgi:hypothetical protein